MAKLFPEFARSTPELLANAISALPDYDTKPPFEMTDERWVTLVEKMKSGRPLLDGEKILLVNNVDRLDPMDIPTFSGAFLSKLDEETLGRASKLVNQTLHPIRSLEVLLSKGVVSKYGGGHLTEGLVQFGPAMLKLGHEEVIQRLLESEQGLQSILDAFAVTKQERVNTAQTLVLRIWLSCSNSDLILEKAYPSFWHWTELASRGSGDSFRTPDQIVGKYLEKHPNWNTQVLNEASIPGRLAQDLIPLVQSDKINLEKYSSLKAIIREYIELGKVLRDLSASVPQRGEFWKNHLSQSSRVDSRTFKVGQPKVAVAMKFGNVVIVEYGPVGNAALIYDADLFYKEVLQQPNWKDRRRTKSMPGFSDGRIIHTEGWMKEARALLRLLMEGKR